MKIAIVQINTTVGDFKGNAAKIAAGLKKASQAGADVALFPELTVCGYPPRDLLEKPSFVERQMKAVESLAEGTGETAAVIGFVSVNESAQGRALFNSAGLLHKGRIAFIQHKTLLPEYDVFDEARYFEPANRHEIFELGGMKLGLSLCEDMWSEYPFDGRRFYHEDPIVKLSGADVVLNLSASPFTLGKHDVRRGLAARAAKKAGVPVIYCNLVGGNDELVFDGQSLVADAKGRIVWQGRTFGGDFFVVDTEKLPPPLRLAPEDGIGDVKKALVLGLKDYMRKCGFKKVVIGISGGIDSALVAALACEAIGAKNVLGVMMPSCFTSKESLTDAKELAKNLNFATRTVDIGAAYTAYRKTLRFKGKKVSLAEENIQARIRGNILMAMSNAEGALVLSTGNKSELACGYCTLYGDMAGGLALISDVPKTMVYELARRFNEKREVIPGNILEKAPTAELKPGQKDSDSLPPYDVLDPILKAYIEDKLSVNAIVKQGFKRSVVENVIGLVDRNEYKRRQAAPGIKVTSKSFGMGRRFPIAYKYSY